MIQHRASSGSLSVLRFSHLLVSFAYVNGFGVGGACVTMRASHNFIRILVNCGILMVMSFIQKDDWTDFHGFQQVSPESQMQYQNFSQMAIMSLFLTLANIICVALGATLMFRMKEVLPVKKKVFWEDLKIARRIYQGRARDDGGEVLTVKTIQDMLRPTYSVEEVVIPSASATITK